ncbi:radical SAM protein [bacterium]|jgi:MoaA/NifB/PqqE/SkfB family radical SAM enzyme|nr:radical SAM protein [bacterium]
MWKVNEIEWIDLETTTYCNIKCPGCLRSNSRWADSFINKDKMDLDKIKEQITRDKFPALRTINLCGSIDEPISHPQIMDYVDWVLSLDVFVHISTNGSLRNENFWFELGSKMPRSKGVGMVTFGIDGTDAETHVKYRVGSDFDKIMRNAEAFIDGGGRAQWQMILFDYNEHQAEEAQRMAIEMGFHKFKTVKSARPKSVMQREEEMEYKAAERDTLPSIKCKYVDEKRVQINNLGNVIPCCYVNSYDLEYNTVPSKEKYKNHIKSLDRQIPDPANPGKYIQEYAYDYIDGYEKLGGMLANNIAYNDIVDVIEGDYFAMMHQSWNTDKAISICKDRCQNRRLDEMDSTIL